MEYSKLSSIVTKHLFNWLLVTVNYKWVKGKAIDTDEEYWYSDNKQYRCPTEDYLAIERRQRGGGWKQVSDYHKYQVMPQSILRDFERAVTFHVSVKSSLES